MFNYKILETPEIDFHQIIPLNEVPPGERLFIEIEGKSIVILNIGEQLFAIGDLCTHDNGPVGDGETDEGSIICPRHGARFDLYTGKAIGLPAVTDIPVYPVRVMDGMIEVGVPREV